MDKGTIFSCHMMQPSWERAWQQTLELQLPGSLGLCTTSCNSWSDHCRTTALFARILSPPYWLSIENLQLQEEEKATPAQLAQTSLLFNSDGTPCAAPDPGKTHVIRASAPNQITARDGSRCMRRHAAILYHRGGRLEVAVAVANFSASMPLRSLPGVNIVSS